jgi:glycosyltransferase involved in cell wall biosynthesis
MKVTIVTPTRDKAPLLRRTLATLAAQAVDAALVELVVVDDGSTDETPRLLSETRLPFPLRVVRHEASRGRAAARNAGLREAAGELILFLDDDMETVPGFVEAHRAAHRARERLVGIGDVEAHPECRVAPIDRYMSTRGAQKIRSRGPLPWKYFSTNNASVRRADLEAIGGFDERFVHYGFEDLELAWRLERERGVEFRFVPDARSLHVHPHTLDEVLGKKTLAGRSSLRYLFAKHPETERVLGFDRFAPPRRGDPLALNAQRVLLRALLAPAVYRAVRPLGERNLGALTNAALDYLVQYHYLAGLRDPI